MTNLSEFLLARIAEDEARAVQTGETGPWRSNYGDVYARGVITSRRVAMLDEGNEVSTVAAEHIAAWGPARVLAECDAKRRIVAGHPEEERRAEVDPELGEKIPDCAADWQPFPCLTLRLLALPFADHPDYDSIEELLP